MNKLNFDEINMRNEFNYKTHKENKNKTSFSNLEFRKDAINRFWQNSDPKKLDELDKISTLIKHANYLLQQCEIVRFVFLEKKVAPRNKEDQIKDLNTLKTSIKILNEKYNSFLPQVTNKVPNKHANNQEPQSFIYGEIQPIMEKIDKWIDILEKKSDLMKKEIGEDLVN